MQRGDNNSKAIKDQDKTRVGQETGQHRRRQRKQKDPKEVFDLPTVKQLQAQGPGREKRTTTESNKEPSGKRAA